MVTIHTDKTGRKFEIHTNIFGSIVKQVEIFDTPNEEVKEKVIEKPSKPKKGKK